MYLSATASYPCTLLTFLRQEMGVSSTLVKRLKWQGTLLVNGEPAHTDHIDPCGRHLRFIETLR